MKTEGRKALSFALALLITAGVTAWPGAVWADAGEGTPSLAQGVSTTPAQATSPAQTTTPAATVTPPALASVQEPKPDAVVQYASETLTNLSAAAIYEVQYSQNSATVSVTASATASGDLAVAEAWIGGTIHLIKQGDGVTTSDSDAQSLTLPARPVSAAGDVVGEQGTTQSHFRVMTLSVSGYEYSLDGRTWTAMTGAPGGAVQVPPGAYKVRIPATAASFHGNELDVTVPRPLTTSAWVTPSAVIDFGAETLRFPANENGYLYDIHVNGGVKTVKVSGDRIAIGAFISNGARVTLELQKQAVTTENRTTSAAQRLTLPMRRSAPKEIAAEQPAASGSKKGALRGFNPSLRYEYKLTGVNDYKAVPAGATRVGDLSVGTYVVRYKATEGDFASRDASFTIKTSGTTTRPGSSAGPSRKDSDSTTKTTTTQTAPSNPGNASDRSRFVDVGSHWAGDAITFVVGRGLFNGVSDTHFQPDAPMTRAMFTTVLSRHAHGSAGRSVTFSDVPQGSWYENGVLWAAENGIAQGTGKGIFSPNDYVTREQIAVILCNYARFAGYGLQGSGNGAAGYRDQGKISPWAVDSVNRAISAGLITGKTGDTLDPGGVATRAEIATIIMRFAKMTRTA